METIRCPFCPQQIALPSAQIPPSVQCPACGQTFTPPPSDAGWIKSPDEPRVPFGGPTPYTPQIGVITASGSADDWDKVRQGISLIYTGIVILLVTVLVAFVGGFAAAAANAPTPIILLVGFLVIVAAFAQVVLQVIGKALCLRAPTAHGARALAIASLALTAAALALSVSGAITTIVAEGAVGLVGGPGGLGRTGSVGSLMSNGGQVADMIGIALFILFLRAVALNLGDEQLAASARQLLLLGGMVLVMLLMMFFILMGVGTRGESIMALLGSCAAIVMAFAAFLKYIGLLSRCRDELALHVHRLRRAAREGASYP